MGSLALNSGPQPDHRDRIIASLETENRELKQQIEEMRLEAQETNKAVEQGVGELRRVLLPLHQAMRLVFGEIERIAPAGGAESATQASPTKSAAWESWKQRLGGHKAKCIDAFLTHGALNQTQLRVIIGCAMSSVPGLISDLRGLGLLNKDGNKFSLKEL